MTEVVAFPYNDTESPLADGFADFLTRLAEKLGAPPAAAAAAGEAGRSCLLSLAGGHVCADLNTLAAARKTSAAGFRELLLKSRVVSGNGELELPLVLDDRGRIYLYRYFAYERQLAAAILARADAAPPQPLPVEVERFLASRFAVNAAGIARRPDRQRLAVTQALSILTVISGGPGTGKTTIVATLIARSPCRTRRRASPWRPLPARRQPEWKRLSANLWRSSIRP